MDKYDEFYSYIQQKADDFKRISCNETIRLISHLDADGLSSGSIMIKAMLRENRQHVVSIVQKLDAELAESLAKEPYKYIAFTDLGSGQFSVLKEKLADKTVYIFDHHKPETIEEMPNIIHINPHFFGIDGSKEVSGAGVAYLFARALDEANKDMAGIAIVGAIGDVQENNGFERVNSDILKDAVHSGKMKVVPGLKIFGAQTKPLHRLLAYSSEHPIPGITGSESAAIQFLNQLGIRPKNGERWRKLIDLDDDELRKLTTGIILKRIDEKHPEAIIGPVYILREEQKESPLRDAKEFSTLLNACGRMDKASLGIGACLGQKQLKSKAIAHLADYKKEITKALKWFEKCQTENKFAKGSNYIIINAGTEVMHTMIGTIASIVSKSSYFENETYVLSMARIGDGNTKVSIRCTAEGKDLRSVISGITEQVNGTFGGHTGAAGAIISTHREEEFMNAAKGTFEKLIPERLQHNFTP
ncbi:DHH family phosphoesterase [Candidatus Woesearchaeota archaeon]|nr:DHH family phosphoesterase [Candidatus Woesearchaeota archaeon]